MDLKSVGSDCYNYSTEDLHLENEKRFKKVIASFENEKSLLHRLDITHTEGKVFLSRNGKVLHTFDSFQDIVVNKAKWSTNPHPYLDYFYGKNVIPKDIVTIHYPKHRSQLLNKFFGISPSKWVKMFRGAMFNAFVPQDLKLTCAKYCSLNWYSKQVDSRLVNNLYEQQDLIRQCLKDGIENIIPFVLDEKLSPKELKSKYGKSVWKQLTKNKPTRNKLLVRKLNACYIHKVEDLRVLIKAPTSFLKTKGACCDEDCIKLIKEERIATKPKLHSDIFNVVRDTKTMYRRLGMEIPKQKKNWKFAKWKEKHDYLTEKINARKYSKDEITWLKELPSELKSECGKFTATLLRSPYEIRMEGANMHHCVGSYSDYVSRGDYVIYHIEGDGLESTLGISKNKIRKTEDVWVAFTTATKYSSLAEVPRYTLNQHYHECNKKVEDKDLIKFEKHVIETLNNLKDTQNEHN